VALTSEQWDGPLGRVLRADTLREAQLATAELIDVVVPGRAVVVSDGGDVVRAIVSTPRLESHPFRAYLLWILVTCGGGWAPGDVS